MKPALLTRCLAMFLTAALTASAASTEKRLGCPDAPPLLDRILGIQATPGAFVLDIKPGSPAEKAGLARCDFIVSFNGYDLRHYSELQPFLYSLREAAMLSSANLEVWKYDAATESYRPYKTRLRLPARFGTLAGFDTTFQIMVLEVPEGSAAARAGIKPWDFIDEIDGEKVSNMRSIIEIDQKVSEAAAGDAGVRLTLARWKPIPPPSEWTTTFIPREVTVVLGACPTRIPR